MTPSNLRRPNARQKRVLVRLEQPLHRAVRLLLLRGRRLIPFNVVMFVRMTKMVTRVVYHGTRAKVSNTGPLSARRLVNGNNRNTLVLSRIRVLRRTPCTRPLILPNCRVRRLKSKFLRLLRVRQATLRHGVRCFVVGQLLRLFQGFCNASALHSSLMFDRDVRRLRGFLIHGVRFCRQDARLTRIVYAVRGRRRRVLKRRVLRLPSHLRPLIRIRQFTVIIMLRVKRVRFRFFTTILF